MYRYIQCVCTKCMYMYTYTCVYTYIFFFGYVFMKTEDSLQLKTADGRQFSNEDIWRQTTVFEWKEDSLQDCHSLQDYHSLQEYSLRKTVTVFTNTVFGWLSLQDICILEDCDSRCILYSWTVFLNCILEDCDSHSKTVFFNCILVFLNCILQQYSWRLWYVNDSSRRLVSFVVRDKSCDVWWLFKCHVI